MLAPIGRIRVQLVLPFTAPFGTDKGHKEQEHAVFLGRAG